MPCVQNQQSARKGETDHGLIAPFCMAGIRDKEGETTPREDRIGLFRASGHTSRKASHRLLDQTLKP